MRERGTTSRRRDLRRPRPLRGLTGRLGFACVALVVCLLLALRAEHAYVATCGAMALIVVGVVWPIVLSRLTRVSIATVADRVRVGEPVALSLRADGPMTLHGLRLDAGALFDPPAALTLTRRRVMQLHLATRRRGVFDLSTITASTGHPFGLFRAFIKTNTRGSVVVWPASIKTDLPASAGATQMDLADESGSTRSGNDDFIGLRSYRRGDSLRLVHWQQSARYDRLIVRQRAGTSRLVAHITLDTRVTVYADRLDAFETCVSVTAGLIEQAIARQMSATLAIGSERIVVRQAEDLVLALDRLAAAQTDDRALPAAQGVLVTTALGATTAGPGWTFVCADSSSAAAEIAGVAA